MKILLIAVGTLLTLTTNDQLTGRWESRPSENGNITGVVFKEGNIMEGYVNRKPFVSGTYFFNAADSIMTFTDNGCDGVSAVYRLLFYSNSDSLRFSVIHDNCTERKNGMQRLVMGRVK